MNFEDTRILGSTMAYRDAVAKLIASIQPTLFVTLAYNCETTLDAASRRLLHLQACLDRHLIGRSWQSRCVLRTSYVATVEHATTNLHIHVAWHVGIEHLRRASDFLTDAWLKLTPAGSINVQPVDDALGLGRYMSKSIAPQISEQLLISPNAPVIAVHS